MNNKALVWGGGIIIVLLAVLTIDRVFLQKNTVYVDFNELYENFQMKVDLENKFKKSQVVHKKQLDSMSVELNNIARGIQSKSSKISYAEFEHMKDQYYMAEKHFDEESNITMNEYKTRILKQINQYSSDYGQKEGYKAIIGSSGGLSVLHMDKSSDITKDLLEYINKRYQGGQK